MAWFELKALSEEMLSKLINKNPLPMEKKIFTDEEVAAIRKVIEDGRTRMMLRGRKYIIRYFSWRKKQWITVRPVKGFVPMFSMPKEDFLRNGTISI